MKKRVVVALSGGADSSAAACLLIKQGYEVIGVSLKLFSPPGSDNSRGNIQGVKAAKNVAHELGIPFYSLNCEKEFENKVINYFCNEYLQGRTPNPCIICNQKIKFACLLEKANNLDANYIATGHYAKIEYTQPQKRYILRKGKDKEKDQSYFLFSLSQEQLRHCLFPLGDYTKDEVDRLTKEFGLTIHNRPSNQDICFINTSYPEFLRTRIDTNKSQINVNGFQPGSIVDTKGKILGSHQGIAFYTVGQRKGIGAHPDTSSGHGTKPLYVIGINRQKNTVLVGKEEELWKDVLIAENINWIAWKKIIKPVKIKARIRYKHQESEAVISSLNDGRVRVKFTQPQRAITPGQAVVFYAGDIVVGGGWIT